MQGAVLKSFTYENKGGNGAGVIILNRYLPTNEKQKIAEKIGLSETAFVTQINDDNFDVSFFTPLCEVNLCGHATIAAFYYLGVIGRIKGLNETKKVYQNTKVGKLEIEITFNDANENNVEYVLMQQGSPKIYDKLEGIDKIKLADSLNINKNDIGLYNYEMSPTIVSTGLKDILIPVKSRKILNNINPNLNMIKEISLEKNVVGYHVYAIDENKLFTRNFAPAVGIDEECATGTSNGALGCLLFENGIVSNQMEIVQGESMNERSLIFVKVNNINNTIDVRVGGKSLIKSNIYL
ncbi:MAG: PhzF family phenazine biosynthesis protein [Sedimentibacter sp.]|uniref:PhzF family phenazine biosynthesis protein n=1 Tax=Sedimentibacter sp. TaxID=1960295 RepID=UPI002980AB40|nr:PhzF family phenazine biosynthesis protein [Sedimentibacter sp.]MDW5300603.1 PhzF family phenazine biosynthesis protein [Sedimentibacter sp.]